MTASPTVICYIRFGCARTTSDPKNVVTCIRFLSFSITIAPSSSSANCKKGYTLTEKEALINELEQGVDNLEQYSIRSSVCITGIEENKYGEQLDKIVTDLFVDLALKLTNANHNRTHSIGPRTSATNKQTTLTKNNRVVQGIEMKRRLLKSKKTNAKRPNVFISEYITQKRTRLLYLCRTMKRQHTILEC